MQSTDNITAEADGEVLYAQWTANTNTKYTVNHYLENVANTSYTLSTTTTGTGTSDASITLANLTTSITEGTYSYGQVGGTTVTTTTISPDGGRVINLYYTRKTYKITVSAGSNGSISPSSATVKYGGSQTFTITPNSGYIINTITVDGSNKSITNTSSMTHTFSNITATHTISATFKKVMEFKLATSLTAGKRYIICDGTNALTNDDGNIVSTTVSPKNNIIQTDDESLIWTFTSNSFLTNNSAGTTHYLGISSNFVTKEVTVYTSTSPNTLVTYNDGVMSVGGGYLYYDDSLFVCAGMSTASDITIYVENN